jgi:hypothetical protein
MTPLLLLFACSDYRLIGGEDNAGGWDDTGVGEICDPDGLGPEVIGIDEDCELAPTVGQFEPEREWSVSTWSTAGGASSIMSTPVVGHLTDDDNDGVYGSAGDVPDIAVMTYGSGNVLRVMSGDGSGEHWASAGDYQGQGIPAIGDVDGDGDPDVVAVTDSATVIALDATGRKLWESDELGNGDWLFPEYYVAEYCSAPAISDMDGDGYAEVIAGRVILDGRTGRTVGMGDFGKGTSSANGDVGTTSFAVDLDLDGQQEVVTGNALYTRTGQLKAKNSDGDGFVAVGNFDDDPQGEVVVVRPGTVAVYNHDMTTLWGPVSIGSGMGGPPTVADFDGDGLAEIGVAGTSIYSVFDTDGSVLWSVVTQDQTSGITGSSVYDFEGDGIAEVVYADEVTLWVLNGPDGSVKLEYTEHASNTWLEYPTIADVDGDGAAEIVLGHNAFQGGGAYPSGKVRTGISVIGDMSDTWTDTREIWNQHAYHITNVNEDGTIPADADVNWESYNNFRSGDLFAGIGVGAPDLAPEVVGLCETECVGGQLWITARVRNTGAGGAPEGVALTLSAGGEDIETIELDAAIPAGEASATVMFIVHPVLVEDGFTLTVDGHDGIPECHEDNNVQVWDQDTCPNL